MDTVSAYRSAMECAWLNSHQVCKKNKKWPLRVHFHYSFLLQHCLLSAVSFWVAGFFIAAVSRNIPKVSINFSCMFTSGITGLVVHINNRELMPLSDLDGDQDYRNNLQGLSSSAQARLYTLLHAGIFKELLPLPDCSVHSHLSTFLCSPLLPEECHPSSLKMVPHKTAGAWKLSHVPVQYHFFLL